jgi:hypothetical protein
MCREWGSWYNYSIINWEIFPHNWVFWISNISFSNMEYSFFFSSKNWNQSLTHASQVLYHWAISPDHFLFFVFLMLLWVRCPGWPQTWYVAQSYWSIKPDVIHSKLVIIIGKTFPLINTKVKPHSQHTSQQYPAFLRRHPPKENTLSGYYNKIP